MGQKSSDRPTMTGFLTNMAVLGVFPVHSLAESLASLPTQLENFLVCARWFLSFCAKKSDTALSGTGDVTD